jgi:hypothetical protein
MEMNSNWTLRFPRTSREAYGYEVRFEKRNPDRIVVIACAILAAFLTGLIVGGVV